MKKLVSLALALAMVLSLVAVSASAQDYSGYTIRIYSNSNSIERVNYLKEEAQKAGFSISIDDNSVLNGDTAAVQAANENKDADLIFGLNETRWGQLIGGTYENIKIADWTPSWADKVGTFKYDGKAYGLVIQNILKVFQKFDRHLAEVDDKVQRILDFMGNTGAEKAQGGHLLLLMQLLLQIFHLLLQAFFFHHKSYLKPI